MSGSSSTRVSEIVPNSCLRRDLAEPVPADATRRQHETANPSPLLLFWGDDRQRQIIGLLTKVDFTAGLEAQIQFG